MEDKLLGGSSENVLLYPPVSSTLWLLWHKSAQSQCDPCRVAVSLRQKEDEREEEFWCQSFQMIVSHNVLISSFNFKVNVFLFSFEILLRSVSSLVY